MKKKLTLSDIEAIDKEFLTPTDISDYLGAHPQVVREGVRVGVPWGYVLGKCRFVIPKQAFVNYHKYGAVIKIND